MEFWIDGFSDYGNTPLLQHSITAVSLITPLFAFSYHHSSIPFPSVLHYSNIPFSSPFQYSNVFM